MNNQDIAIISDIHGNSFALVEVLRDIKEKGIETIINLGDSLYGPLDPKGTFEQLSKHNINSIAGNQDRFILENLDNKSDIPTLEYVKSQIDILAIEWLKSLKFDMVFNDKIYCCHATPQSDSIYLLEKLEEDFISVKTNMEINNLLSSIKEEIIVCGHSHVPRIVKTNDKIIINPGSIGLPAYDDDLPIFHKMENHNPFANYVILNFSEDNVKINRISIEYDIEAASNLAKENNRNDWAKWIKTGSV